MQEEEGLPNNFIYIQCSLSPSFFNAFWICIKIRCNDILTFGKALVMVLAAAGVEKRLSKMMFSSSTACSWRTLTALMTVLPEPRTQFLIIGTAFKWHGREETSSNAKTFVNVTEDRKGEGKPKTYSWSGTSEEPYADLYLLGTLHIPLLLHEYQDQIPQGSCPVLWNGNMIAIPVIGRNAVSAVKLHSTKKVISMKFMKESKCSTPAAASYSLHFLQSD